MNNSIGMEAVEESEPNVLREIVSDEELAQIPRELTRKINAHFNAKFEEFITAKAIFETNRKCLEQNWSKAQKELAEHKSNLEEYKGKLELAEKSNTETCSNLEGVKIEVHRLQESVKRLEKENGELRRQRDTATDEANALQLQVERRDTEIERMRTELSSYSSQLQTAIAAKCQTLAETEEIRSREMTLDYKEKRLEQERVLFSQQIAGLEEELAKRTSELQTVRSEASARALLIDTKLSQREEELRITNEANSQLRESVSSLQKLCDELTQKVEQQRAHEIAINDSYQKEINAQKNLSSLYESMKDDANSKSEELSNAASELQKLVDSTAEEYGILETKYNQLLLQHKQDIDEKEQNIQELTKELEHANELLKNIQQEQLNQAVEQLAPTAAITSRVLRKGASLTQIYTQLVEATNELVLAKEENGRLKCQMDAILRELEQKAPLLQQQREDYEAAMTNIATLTNRVDELLAENQRLHENSDEANRLAKHHTKENLVLKTQSADLARQVCFLLKEVQENRTGTPVETRDLSSSVDTDDILSSQIIGKKLVTFRNIEELQENNQKLLAVVRALSSRQEEIERATNEINSGEMKEKLDHYMEQLADMQAAQDRQSRMFDGLLKQRDMYKNMYHQIKNSGEKRKEEVEKDIEEGKSKSEEKSKTKSDEEKEKLSSKLKEAEDKFKHISDEYETYRKDRTAHEKMLSEEVEKLRKEAEAKSGRCCALKAQLDSANDRFTNLQTHIATYKTQIKALEDKCNNYSVTISKHEQSIMMLKDETLAAQSRLSRAEVQLDNIRQERQLLKDSETRLLKEREVFQRERHSQALLYADVESIKASLERVQAEGQLRAEQRLDDANRECAALRRRLQEEQDRFRELTAHLERQFTTAQERLKEERELSERLKTELDQAREIETQCSQRIDELTNKLRQATAHSIAKPLTGEEDLVKRVKELQVQLSTSQVEAKSFSEQLKAARQQSQQYCDIAESAETQLREMTTEYNKCKEELENALKESRVEIISLQKRVKDLSDDLAKISNGRHETDSELRNKLAEAERKVEELDELKGELELLKSDLKSVSVSAKEAEDKYAREMMQHSSDLQILAKLKEETEQIQYRLDSLTQERNAAVEALEIEKSASKQREQKYINEIEECQKRITDLDTQNALLHNQIQELGDRVSIMQSQQTKISGRDSPDTSMEALNKSFSSMEEDSNSVEQLLKVMKYLRREKDLAIAKSDVLRAENLRLKSQTEIVEKRLKETETLLNSEREKAEIDVKTTSKHAELLRKVETLNAITDSNRILREERDSLIAKVNQLTAKVNALSEEVIPLRDVSRDLTAKTEALTEENTSLKGEATRWRQRANMLLEKANKASPEDWRRLQTERENLSKLLTSERETHAKRSEEFNQVKTEKAKLEEQLMQLQKQLQTQDEQISRASEEVRKLGQELNEALADSSLKAKDLISLKKELSEKEVILNDIRNKEIQIRKIAKKYKTQFEELAKNVEEEKSRNEENRNADASNVTQERENQLREEGRQELRQANIELTTKIDEVTRQMTTAQSEADNLRKEIEAMNRSSVEKEDRAKQVLKGARTKIMQLTESKKICEKELLDLKARLESAGGSAGDQGDAEHDTRLLALKSQMEGRISRLEHEKSEIQAEKEALLQRVSQLQRQLSGVSGVSATTEPPTANIKPMSARAETPLASIRPMSVVVQSRTAAVLPTTAGAPVMVAPHQMQQQQVVHTTETSSPTSSLTDFQPASTSTSSQSAQTSSLRQLVVQPQLSESAESTQREDPESAEPLNLQPQQQQCQQQQQQQQQQQTVALVSPRVEQQQQQQITVSDQQQTVASSSTQSVSTSQASTGLKRARVLDSTASGSGIVEGLDHGRQEQSQSPKTKRSRQDISATASASASEVEYQVPTSSQRDQDEEVEEGCVVVVDCDEGEGGGNHQAQEEEEFDNDTYEEIEEEEEMPYEVEVEVERDNNEVEIIMEEDSSVEISRQGQAIIPTNQQQSEAISSAGPTGEPATSFTTRSRGIAPMPRQQQQQHLLLPQQGYEDGGDDCIVPSTPTLFVPRRDGFGEAVSSPQVPQGRFTFGDPSAPTTASSTPSLTTPAGSNTRIFGSTNSAVVVQESLDDSRIDLTQLEDGGTGRSVPTTPLQVSPAADLPPSTSSSQSEEQENTVTHVSATATSGDSVEDPNIPSIRIVSADDPQRGSTEATESSATPSEVSSEGDKRVEEPVAAASSEDDVIDPADATEEAGSELAEEEVEEENREAEASPSSNTRQRTMAASLAAAGDSNNARGVTVRRSPRSPFRAARGARPTPIVWGDSQSGRGQPVMRGHATRGAANEGGRGRGARGRRMRSKYPYARYS
ncbi:nucleoprotein TPR [Solenopsis invicta]|uniref:nucleoprotein TPR n=1 Tax=Solenopsis invicta TaxID=13686 RepID=UPI000595C4BC|nr:nucleoprotein TPR [Solenopsis invicta]XP_011168946.1 nucleoprotein TPR [Solenopsis invicta]XP_011168947.1 nucleoprotein TPR [Solenopsis invicta]